MAYIAKYWWIGALVSLASSVVGGLCGNLLVRTTEHQTDPNALSILMIFSSALVMFVCYLTIILTMFVPVILIITRFYKHFFTDEGYLTFTLPAKRSTLLLSKTVTATFWLSLQSIVLIVSIYIFVLLLYPKNILPLIWSEICLLFQTQWEALGIWLILWDIILLFESSVLTVFSAALSVAWLHFFITLGSTMFKKAKLILSLVLYYVLNSTLGAVSYVVIYVSALFMSPGFLVLIQSATPAENMFIGSLILWIIASVAAVAFFIVYSITQYLLDRRLNLA